MTHHDPPATREEALLRIGELRDRLAQMERWVGEEAATRLPQGEFTVLVFRAAGAEMALLAGSVQEVVPFAWLAPIPEAPPWIAGVLELGGRMICVLDVAARLTRTPHRPRPNDLIIICRGEHRRIGLCVSAVRAVTTFASGAAEPPPPDVPYAPYLAATIKNGSSPLLLVGIELLLRTSEVPEVPEVPP